MWSRSTIPTPMRSCSAFRFSSTGRLRSLRNRGECFSHSREQSTTCAVLGWGKAHAALMLILSGAFISLSCASAPSPTTPLQELPPEVLFLTLQASGEEMPGVEVQLVTRRG